jgi:hypothetical protein
VGFLFDPTAREEGNVYSNREHFLPACKNGLAVDYKQARVVNESGILCPTVN